MPAVPTLWCGGACLQSHHSGVGQDRCYKFGASLVYTVSSGPISATSGDHLKTLDGGHQGLGTSMLQESCGWTVQRFREATAHFTGRKETVGGILR